MRGRGAAAGALLALAAAACEDPLSWPGTDGGLPPEVDAGPDAGGAAGQRCPEVPEEAEPNDTRDRAISVRVDGTALRGCIAGPGDRDQYVLSTPAHPAGGFVELSVTDVGDGQPILKVFSGADEGLIIDHLAGTRGQSLRVWVAVASGQRLRAELGDFSAAGGRYAYSLSARYTAAEDPHEPNDTRAAATPIAVGAPVRALLFAGHQTAQPPSVEAYDDWFALPLRQDAVTAQLTTVPANVSAELRLFDASGRELARAFNVTPGGAVSLTHRVGAGGHFVKVGVFAPRPAAAGTGPTLPEHVTRPYTLTVTQP